MSKRPLVPNAEKALDQFKMEIANELGIEEPGMEYGYIPEANSPNSGEQNVYHNVKKGGNIGGEMVKRMIERAEESMIDDHK